MWRYLKAAFLVGVEVPGLGRLPLNGLMVAAVAILGFVEPSLWLAGLGIETALLSLLAFHPRFQNYVDAMSGRRMLQDDNAKRAALIAVLPEELRCRLRKLEQTGSRILAIYVTLGIDQEVLAGTRASLRKFRWIYLKLLIARYHLDHELGAESEASLQARIQQMQQASSLAAQASASTALQRSQEATVALLQRRLDNLRNRDCLLSENETDLARIEAQVELMRENAAIDGKPASVESEIEIASDLASPDLFGSHNSLVRELDAARR